MPFCTVKQAIPLIRTVLVAGPNGKDAATLAYPARNDGNGRSTPPSRPEAKNSRQYFVIRPKNIIFA
jgi:hypothetical protein